MRIKRYEVRDMQEAYVTIRRDLGPEAMIISTRNVRQKGLLGFLLPPHLEVTAAVETAAEWTKGVPDQINWQELRQDLGEIKRALGQMREGLTNGQVLPELGRALAAQELGDELVEKLLAKLPPESLADEAMGGEVIRARLADHLLPLIGNSNGARVQVFLGPTGVGKTTTLAKLAAQASIFRHEQVGLITLDNYRIGAVAQLRTYGEIMGLPFEIAMTPAELRVALEKLQECDRILIDTAGRPPGSNDLYTETKGFLRVLPEHEAFLVLSCTARYRDLLQAVQGFAPFGYDRLIITKLDESSCPGVIVPITQAAGVPLAYLCTGQAVPEDIEAADPYRLANRIWERVAADGSSGGTA